MADERRRLARIMGTPEAAGREQLALAIATTTSKSVDEARAALTAAPIAAAADVPATAGTIKAERARFATILALPEAKGREGLAVTLATTTDMSADQIKVALAAAPAAVAGERAGDTEIGLSVDQGKQQQNSQSTSVLWDAALTSRGMKMQATATPNSPHHRPNPPGLPDWNASLKSRGMKTS
ncbi:hypothetical protein [Bradyrhizobium sp. SSUT77]|uniref:hypothetical protein n=1 Tax=Bradyrhizobium sp. SSUT77 TaxID=3040603 RepID=UPI00244ACFF5|nr:hypothetical protein [Bradyrhizobium sp. SSUT77]MDH2341506.1 hypothetical protein [Bradyrhizobium sp. SSUT77]